MLGSSAPDFSLLASNGNNIRLSSLRPHWVILVFYPINNSPTCNRQLDELSAGGDELFRRGARIFGVNTASVEKQKAYCEKRQLTFPILSDPGGQVARQFRCRFGFFSLNRRTVVVIDPEGKIVFYRRGAPSLSEVCARASSRLSNITSSSQVLGTR